MTALYNEIDKNAAAWLRQLIIAGHIAPGVVDERDIRDLEPEYVASFTQCHFFAGIGVWSHALRLAGWSDDRPIWTGSCPCQPFSAAGKGGGFDDERHLWPAFHHLIEQCRPDVVLGEQVASKDGLNWLDLVHADLEGTGYAVGAVDTCAAGFGAPHIRQRLWWCGIALVVGVGQGLEGRGEPGRERAGELVAGSGGLASGLADTLDSFGRPNLSAGHDTTGPDARRSQDSGDAGAGGGLCGVADSSVIGREWGRAGETRPEPGSLERPHGLRLAVRLAQSGVDPAHPIPAPQPGAHHPDRLDDDDSNGPRQAVGGVHQRRAQPDGSQLRPGPTNGIWGAADWLHCRDGRWRPVEASPQPLVDGSAESLGRVRPETVAQIEGELNEWADRTQIDAGEALREVLRSYGADAQFCWPTSGLPGLHESPFLLAFVRQLAAQGWGLAQGVSLPRPEAASSGVRGLWQQRKAAGSSCERGLAGQSTGEPADPLHFLSSLLARHAQAAWGDAYAAHAEIGFPLGRDSRSRVARLRGYGNAIVAPAAQAFIASVMEAVS